MYDIEFSIEGCAFL